MSLGNLQAQRSHKLSVQPVPGLNCPQRKKKHPFFQTELHLFPFNDQCPSFSLCAPQQRALSHLPDNSSSYWKAAHGPPQSQPYPGLSKLCTLRLSSPGTCCKPVVLVTPRGAPSQHLSFTGSQIWTTDTVQSVMESNKCHIKASNYFP